MSKVEGLGNAIDSAQGGAMTVKSGRGGGQRARPVAVASRRGSTYRRGRSTREAIVSAAEEVLVEYGHAQFSVKRVAAHLGISSGNLNYYFPTRAELLEALILHILARYRKRVHALAPPSGAGSPEDFAAVLTWLMEDSLDPHVARLFRQLWAIAASEKRVAAAMDRFYARSVRGHLRRLGVKAAATKEFQDLEAIMTFLHAITEGTIVLFGTRPGGRTLFDRVRALAAQAVAGRVADVRRGDPET